MADVNLDDLKIDHSRTAGGKRFPLIAVILVFLLGGACGYGLVHLWPSLFLKGSGIPEKQTSGSTNNTGTQQGGETEPEGKKGPPDESFTEGGWIEVPSYHPVVVSALIPGRLEELNVLESSRVKKGEVIAVLYQKDLKDEMDRAAAEVRVSEADLLRFRTGFRVQEIEQARADLQAAAADLELKDEIRKRTAALLESGAVSAEDLDRDQAAFRVAGARHETLRQELLLKEEGFRKEEIQAAEAELERRMTLLKLARNRYDYTVIKSPMDGVVLERFVTPGTYIPSTDPGIVSLYDPGDLQVRVDVRQENIGSAFIGQDVEVFTDVEPDKAYLGRVIRIDPLADFKKNTIQVKIKLLDPSDKLHPEMIARIRFKRRAHDQDHGEN